jgi:hypothetical protein
VNIKNVFTIKTLTWFPSSWSLQTFIKVPFGATEPINFKNILGWLDIYMVAQEEILSFSTPA